MLLILQRRTQILLKLKGQLVFAWHSQDLITPIERVFSIINALWTDEKTDLK
jgi:hypothetical protein